ncbi:N-terminal cleavage protein [Opitutaceae bacterium TAV5]|nr:N-terminal cleavage protein [Opitutaceae bacterium TAV5]
MHQKRACHHRRAFTLIELLAVIAIIGILAAILIPVVGLVRNKARASASISNLRQIFLALSMHADENRDKFPLATATVPWKDWEIGETEPENMSWSQQLSPYINSRDFFHTPRFDREGSAYFLGTRAAYIRDNDFSQVIRSLIEFPAQFVLAGETNYKFSEPDYDKDDYTQNCVKASDGTLFSDGTQAILFADGHVSTFKDYDSDKMTFRYDSISAW